MFPRRFDMEFKPVSGPRTQSMITVLAPLAPDADLAAWRRKIGELGMPAESTVEAAFTATGVIHFASARAIDLGETGAPAPHLLLEVNGDGDAESLIDAIETHASDRLLPLFRSAAMRAQGRSSEPQGGQSLGELLESQRA